MAKMQIVGEKAIISGMSVKGGDLPSNFEVKIDVEIDFAGATKAQMLQCCASGQSARVQLQGQLRKKSTTNLTEMASKGHKVKFTDILAGPPPASAGDLLLALSKEDFIELMCEDYDLSADRAEKMYNIKHGISVE